MGKRIPSKAPIAKGGVLFQAGREAGITEGRRQMREEVLKFTEEKYLGPDSPPADTVEAKAILSLTRELSAHMRENIQ